MQPGTFSSNGSHKRPFASDKRLERSFKKQKGNREKVIKEGSQEETLLADVRELLKKSSSEVAPKAFSANSDGDQSAQDLPDLFTELDVTVSELSSTGDGLALSTNSSHVYVVPFSAPGDTVTVKVFKHLPHQSYSLTDFVRVAHPSPLRNDSLIKCPYFASCSGCQFQMLPYDHQLAHKKAVVQKAYRNFSDIPSEHLPDVGDTIASPLQYGYRTKLTPHFDGPENGRRDRKKGIRPSFSEVPPIGFMKKGTRETIDIEDCPIATDAVREGLKRERARVSVEIGNYKRGATLLLRESTKRIPNKDGSGETASGPTDSNGTSAGDHGAFTVEKTCVTDSNATTSEYVDDYIFSNPAGAFFQNNNSILPIFTSYIRDHILPSSPANPPIRHLIDAYSGSGLFTVTLSAQFQSSLGIDIAETSIAYATKNLQANGIDPSRASFIAADASNIFASVKFPPSETAVVIDPPRKGCDANFLRQLLNYSPARIVYVSCNVHTQARDVGLLVKGMDGVDGGFGVGRGVYDIESIRGFDFFPQTGHVEAVAVLQKRQSAKDSE